MSTSVLCIADDTLPDDYYMMRSICASVLIDTHKGPEYNESSFQILHAFIYLYTRVEVPTHVYCRRGTNTIIDYLRSTAFSNE